MPRRISLNWPLDAQSSSEDGEDGDGDGGDGGGGGGGVAFFNRRAFHQELFAKPPRTVNDDIWTFNSQGSSQWDGLRHYGYQKEKLFYNGVTMEDIHCHHHHQQQQHAGGVDGKKKKKKKEKKSTVNGIHGMCVTFTVPDIWGGVCVTHTHRERGRGRGRGEENDGLLT